MQRYILRRLFQSVACLLVLITIVFFASRLSGDPLTLLLPVGATKEQEETVKVHLGLDKPLHIQYVIFIRNMAKGDLGKALYWRRPVTEMLWSRLPGSLQLAGASMLIAVLVGVPIGVFAAVKRGTGFDWGGRTIAVLGQSVPVFWLGLMLVLVFAVWLRLLPTGGQVGPASIILPAVTLGFNIQAGIMRLTRSSMLDVLDSEYIKLARIKGVSEWMVIWKHAFQNALLPVVTYGAIMLATLMGGAIVTETVFAWPGLGRLMVQAIRFRDYPVVQGVVLLLGLFFIMANLGVDILYAYINPKIRYVK